MSVRTRTVLPLVATAAVAGAVAFAGSAAGNGGGSTQPTRTDPETTQNGYSAWDEQWLMSSIEGDNFEIAAGKLAQTNGTTAAIRDLGATLVRDHTKSLAESTAIAENLGIDVPADPSPQERWALHVLKSVKGSTFDHWYAQGEALDHVQDIQEARDEVDNGYNGSIVQNASSEIPTLQQHLKMAKAAMSGLK